MQFGRVSRPPKLDNRNRVSMAEETNDELGFGLKPAMAEPYRVLARKYRPQDFTGLIGQEALVRTLKNAFAKGRIAA